MCLMELDPLLKSPILDVEWERSAPGTSSQDWVPHKAYSNKIGSRFPKASDLLVSRLGQANYERYLRCQQERERQASNHNGDDGLDGLLRLAGKGTSDAASSMFHDSGLGSSLPTSYAETIMSYRAEGETSVRIPSLPPGAKDGKPFQCVACEKSVLIRNNSAWKQHLYEDLQPWLCLDVACSVGNNVFASRLDWVSHLALGHGLDPEWKSFECPLCFGDTGAGKIAITKHLGSHLEEISLAALPSNPDFESEDGESEGGEGDSMGMEDEQEAGVTDEPGQNSDAEEVRHEPEVLPWLPPSWEHPQWLEEALGALRLHYPHAQFEITRLRRIVETESDAVVNRDPPASEQISDDGQFVYFPVIRCLDCPGELYSPGPDATVVRLEIHLKSPLHRRNIDARLSKLTSTASLADQPIQSSVRHPGRSDHEDDSETIEIEAKVQKLLLARQREILRLIEADTKCKIQCTSSSTEDGNLVLCKIIGVPERRAEVKAAISRIRTDSNISATPGAGRNSRKRGTASSGGGGNAQEPVRPPTMPIPEPSVLDNALAYLDEIKRVFTDIPSVYNSFLDIMKDFKSMK